MIEHLPSDLQGPDQKQRIQEQWPPTLLDSEFKVHIGPPSFDSETGIVRIPHEPHIFRVEDLYVNESSSEDPSDPEKHHHLGRVNVLVAHGYRRGGHWVFDDNRWVDEVVGAYNKSVSEKGIPEQQIDYLIVCNPADTAVVPTDKEVRIAAAEEERLRELGVGFIVGSKVGVTIRPEINSDNDELQLFVDARISDPDSGRLVLKDKPYRPKG